MYIHVTDKHVDPAHVTALFFQLVPNAEENNLCKYKSEKDVVREECATRTAVLDRFLSSILLNVKGPWRPALESRSHPFIKYFLDNLRQLRVGLVSCGTWFSEH